MYKNCYNPSTPKLIHTKSMQGVEYHYIPMQERQQIHPNALFGDFGQLSAHSCALITYSYSLWILKKRKTYSHYIENKMNRKIKEPKNAFKDSSHF